MANLNPEKGYSPEESEQPPKIFIPESYGESRVGPINPAERKREYDELKEEEKRKEEEEKKGYKVIGGKKESKIEKTPIIGKNPLEKEEPVGDLKNEIPKKKINIEVVSGFENKRTKDEDRSRQRIVKDIEKGRIVREKLKKGELVSSADLSALTEKERGEKKEFQEEVVAHTGEQTKKDGKNRALEILSNPDFLKMSPKEVVKAFREITTDESGKHRHLAKERNEMVERNVKARGHRIIRGRENIEKVRQEIATKERVRTMQELREKAVGVLVSRVPEKYKKDQDAFNKYIDGIKSKLGLDSPKGTLVFDRLVNDGYLVEKAKTGWFSDKVKLLNLNPKKQFIQFNKTKDIDQLSDEAWAPIVSEAQVAADIRVEQGKQRIRQERKACVGKIVSEVVEEYKKKEAPQEKNEAEEEIPTLPEDAIVEAGEKLSKAEKKVSLVEKFALLNDLRNQWEKATKIHTTMKTGRKIKISEGEVLDPKIKEQNQELEKIKGQFSDKVIKKVKELTGRDLLKEAKEATGYKPRKKNPDKEKQKEFQNWLTKEVQKIFKEQVAAVKKPKSETPPDNSDEEEKPKTKKREKPKNKKSTGRPKKGRK